MIGPGIVSHVCCCGVLGRAIYLVPFNGVLQTLVAVWIEIVGPYENVFLSCRNGKGAHASHDIADCFSRFELVYEAAVLCVKSGVPVDFRVIESKSAVLFVDFYVHVVFAC